MVLLSMIRPTGDAAEGAGKGINWVLVTPELKLVEGGGAQAFAGGCRSCRVAGRALRACTGGTDHKGPQGLKLFQSAEVLTGPAVSS